MEIVNVDDEVSNSISVVFKTYKYDFRYTVDNVSQIIKTSTQMIWI